MAKISFNKFNAKMEQGEEKISFNGQDIEVKKYLPIEKKIELAENIVNISLLKNANFYNPIEVEVLEIVSLVEYYTNISFTEKQKQDIYKLYDVLVSSKMAKTIIEAISDEELNSVQAFVHDTLKNIYNYNNSAYGILDSLSNNYNELSFDAEKIKNTLSENSKEILALKELFDNN